MLSIVSSLNYNLVTPKSDYHRNLSDPSNEYLFVHLVRQVDGPNAGIRGKGPGALAAVLAKLQKAEDEAKQAQESFESHINLNCTENIKVRINISDSFHF